MSTPAQYSLIQTVNPSTATGTITASPTSTLVGSLILVFVGMSAVTETVSTVTDNGGNTYTKAYSQNGGTGGNIECWYARNTNPTNSIVITFSGAVSTKSVFVREYGGMSQAASVFDRTASTSGTGTSPSSGATSATQDVNELVVSNCVVGGTNPTLAAGGGFGNFTSQTVIAGLTTHGIEDLTASSLAAQTGTMTAGGTSPVWDIGVATFIISGGKFYRMPNALRPAVFKPGQSAYGR